MQITVKTRTPQGRDTLLRIAADGAISAAMDQNLLMLSGIQPKRFIAGIACDLGEFLLHPSAACQSLVALHDKKHVAENIQDLFYASVPPILCIATSLTWFWRVMFNALLQLPW